MMTTGPAFALDRIDSEPVLQVSKDLLPWLIKDRREAEKGSTVKDSSGKTVHDGAGLEKAVMQLRRTRSALEDASLDDNAKAFLIDQLLISESKVAFYRGKIHLLNKILAQGGVEYNGDRQGNS